MTVQKVQDLELVEICRPCRARTTLPKLNYRIGLDSSEKVHDERIKIDIYNEQTFVVCSIVFYDCHFKDVE